MDDRELLMGVWSVDIMYPPAAQSDDVIYFFADGTGRLDFHNPVICNCWAFSWQFDGNDTIRITGVRQYLHEDGLQSEAWSYNHSHGISIRDEITPKGKVMRVLRLAPPLISGLSDHFAYCGRASDVFEEPDFSYYDR